MVIIGILTCFGQAKMNMLSDGEYKITMAREENRGIFINEFENKVRVGMVPITKREGDGDIALIKNTFNEDFHIMLRDKYVCKKGNDPILSICDNPQDGANNSQWSSVEVPGGTILMTSGFCLKKGRKDGRFTSKIYFLDLLEECDETNSDYHWNMNLIKATDVASNRLREFLKTFDNNLNEGVPGYSSYRRVVTRSYS
ncbi:hypothetical protein SLOPH_536 [Spraguea lophii 42_110]|uniref:Uncharacterized protein n=1 Tax=Spraguea lophii (strain 42_110) TaxID=1358809 RepID=S7WA71_SPRLO|nr:hypothetical protein SLOPH_536 [Spraguea lophii 42_110]